MSNATSPAAATTTTPAPAAVSDGAPPAAAPVATPAPGASALGGAPAPAATTPAPEAFEVKYPEGFDGAKATPFFKELGLKAEQAQKLVDFQAAQQKASLEARDAAWAKADEAKLEALKSDKEIGGAQFDASLAAAKRAVVAYVGPDAGKLFDARLSDGTRLGNHPELVRAFVRIGKAMAEDSVGTPGAPARPASQDPLARARDIYTHPTSQQMFKTS